MLASPTLSPTSRAAQPRSGAPAWPQRGSELPRALMAAARFSSGARLAVPWAASVGGSEFSRSGRWGGAHGCTLQTRGVLLAPSLAPEAHAWISPMPPQPLWFRRLAERLPLRGCRRSWGAGGGIPLAVRVSPPYADPSSVRRRENHFKAAQPTPPAQAGGGGAARRGTGKEVTFKPRAQGDQERGLE